ncbi:ubiquinol-cytochrome-c reductase complex subunit-domain-containing protein [Massariosphaeria phaeospora]|uniref:Ubiquinol-cytochrome-c reductase complex subunit-domain-containing protein n=1 Tax=Massariosphaeria phaeospora TaxID=100035 RepID=A0A7C8IFH3_9PLEO|nr:ubiquinol-cytochrome-c reductase complex subunit-domain-containing protein [Massariosphaeria phaeospora]
MRVQSPPSGVMGKTPAAISMRSPYKAYRSPFGPQYKVPFNYHGLTSKGLMRYGTLAGGFGGVAGIFALFFFAEVPKVRDDIMKKVPVIGSFFIKEIAPEDNPF